MARKQREAPEGTKRPLAREVFLCANWQHEKVLAFARAHKLNSERFLAMRAAQADWMEFVAAVAAAAVALLFLSSRSAASLSLSSVGLTTVAASVVQGALDARVPL